MSKRSRAPEAVAALALAAALAIIYGSQSRRTAPLVDTSSPAPAQTAPAIVAAQAAPAPAQSSPLPYAAPEMRAEGEAARPAFSATFSDYQVERDLSKNDDALVALASLREARPEPRVVGAAGLEDVDDSVERLRAAPVGHKAVGRGALLKTLEQTAAEVAYPPGKVLTIFVTPWCPICESGVAQYRELRRDLSLRGIDVRIVATDDAPERLESFARRIGPGASAAPGKANPFHAYPAAVFSNGGKPDSVHFGNFGSTREGDDWTLALAR